MISTITKADAIAFVNALHADYKAAYDDWDDDDWDDDDWDDDDWDDDYSLSVSLREINDIKGDIITADDISRC